MAQVVHSVVESGFLLAVSAVGPVLVAAVVVVTAVAAVVVVTAVVESGFLLMCLL